MNLAKGQFSEAIDEFQKVIKSEPNFAPVYFYRGLAYLGNNNLQMAKNDFIEALKIAPTFIEANLALAELHLKSGSYDLAIEVAQKVLKEQPANAKAGNPVLRRNQRRLLV